MAQVSSNCISRRTSCSGHGPQYRSAGLFTIPSQSQAPSLSENPASEQYPEKGGSQKKDNKKAPPVHIHESARNNLENTYGKKFDKYYSERNCYMSKKFNNLSLVNDKTKQCECPVHSRKCKKAEDMRKLEENYWAQWKPVKTESEGILVKAKTDTTLNLKKHDASTLLPKTSSVLPYVKVPIITNYVQCKTCFKFIEKDQMKKNCTPCQCSDAVHNGNTPNYGSELSCRSRTINESDKRNNEMAEENYCSSGSMENKNKTKKSENENNTKKINKENKSVKDDDCIECQRRKQNSNILYLSSKNTYEIPEQDKEISVTEICPPRCNILLTSGEDSISSADGQSMGNDSDNIIKSAVQDMTQYIVTRFTEHNPLYKSNGSPQNHNSSPENNTTFRSDKPANKNSAARSQAEDIKSNELQNLRSEKFARRNSVLMSPRSHAEDNSPSNQNELQLKENVDNIKYTRNLINKTPRNERASAELNNKPMPENSTGNVQPSTMISGNANVQPSTIIYPNVNKQLAAMISPRASMQSSPRTSLNANMQTTTMANSNVNKQLSPRTSPRPNMQPATRISPNANVPLTTMASPNVSAYTSPRANMQPATMTSPNANVQLTAIASPNAAAYTSPRVNMQPATMTSPNANVQLTTMASPNAAAYTSPRANMQPATVTSPNANVQLTTMVSPNVTAYTSPKTNLQPVTRPLSPNRNIQPITDFSDVEKQQTNSSPNTNLQPATLYTPHADVEPVTVIYPNVDTTYTTQTNLAQYPSTIMEPLHSIPQAERTVEQSHRSSGIFIKPSGRASFLKGHSYPLKPHKVNLLRPAITGAKYKFK